MIFICKSCILNLYSELDTFIPTTNISNWHTFCLVPIQQVIFSYITNSSGFFLVTKYYTSPSSKHQIVYSRSPILDSVNLCIIHIMTFQLQVEPISKGHHSAKYYGMAQACLVIHKEEGIRAFWKGHIPAQALSVVYGVVQVSWTP